MDNSVNGHIKQGKVFTEWVWYSGTDKLRKGEGVCYNVDYGTATQADGSRCNRVERPDTSNNMCFAGVAARDYAAHDKGQFVEIYNPGSVCPVAVGQNVTLNQGIVTAQAGGGQGAGRFSLAGMSGRGSALPLQTISSVLERVVDGSGSLATDGVTLTVNDSSDMSAGDIVVILGGENDGTGAVVPGKYAIDSITDSTTIVLKESAVTATPGAALNCSYYVYSGNAVALCRLMDGPESGLVEVVTPPNTGSTDVMNYMAGGITYLNGNITISSANAEGDLADGEYVGQQKGIQALAGFTTNAVQVDFATNGKQLATGSSSTTLLTLASANFTSADDLLFAEWRGYWQELAHLGVTLNTS